MFESQVAEILERLLGAFFEVDVKSLNISLFNSKVDLHNLRLRSSALDALGLPIKVLHGQVRHVELELSLQNLRGSPARLLVEGVDVVAVESCEHCDGEAFHARARDARRQRLREDRDLRRQELLCSQKDQKDQRSSVMTRMVTAFVNNLFIHLTDVCVRFRSPAESSCCSEWALHVESFSLASTDSVWKPATTPTEAVELFKQAELRNLCIVAKYDAGDVQALEETIVTPMDLLCRSRMLLAVPEQKVRPVASLEIHVGAASAGVTDTTIRELRRALDSLARAGQRRQRTASRPRDAPTYRGHYAKWWRYAISQIRDQVQSRRQAWSPHHLSAQRKRGREYEPLFTRALGLLPLPGLEAEEEAAMLALEDEMPESMVLALRAAAQLRVRTEGRSVLTNAVASAQADARPAAKAGILSRLFGMGGDRDRETQDAGGEGGGTLKLWGYKVRLNKKELRVLEEVVEASSVPLALDSADDAEGWTKYAVTFTIEKAQVAIATSRAPTPLLRL
jgi:hypothetical protein